MEKIEKVLPKATLCYPRRGEEVLLALKTRGICEGKRNGFGGGIEEPETLEECCVRETLEECGLKIDPRGLEKVAIVYFHNTKTNGQIFICEVHVYFANEWKGEPCDGDGMIDPKWYLEMPYEEMAPGDKYWLPPILAGKKIIARMPYGPFQKELLGPVEIEYIDSFPID